MAMPGTFVPAILCQWPRPALSGRALSGCWIAESPFYIKPRLSRELIDWSMKFIRSANARSTVERSAIPLRDIAMLSKRMYEEWLQLPGFDFAYEQKGLLDMFQTQQNAEHAQSYRRKGAGAWSGYGIPQRKGTGAGERNRRPTSTSWAPYILNATRTCTPNKLMHNLRQYLPPKACSWCPARK